MRVLVVNRYWKQEGGAETCVRETVELLEERGHEAIVFAMADPENWPSAHAEYFPPAIDFRSRRPGDRLRALWRATTARDSRRCLSRLLDDHPVDVAHVFNAYHYLGSNVLLELHRRRIPVILSLHDYKVACPNAIFFSDRTRTPCTVCLEKRLGFVWAPPVLRCRSSSVSAGVALTVEAVGTNVHRLWRRVPDVVTVLNPLQRRAAERAGVDPARIHALPNPVTLTESPVDETATHGRHALFVGRLMPPKGVDVLVRACSGAGVPLRVVGDGDARPGLEALARDLGAEVVFTGELAPDAVRQEMAGAGVLAVPSLWPDVAPLVVTEAWAAGTPVVGSALGGIAAFLEDGRGIACPPGDPAALGAAIRVVLDDPTRAETMVARGRALAAGELSRERWIERLVGIYARVDRQL